jgi:hypothetical protein
MDRRNGFRRENRFVNFTAEPRIRMLGQQTQAVSEISIDILMTARTQAPSHRNSHELLKAPESESQAHANTLSDTRICQ